MKTLIDNEEMKILVSEKFMMPHEELNGKSLADYILQNTLEKFGLYRKIFGVTKLTKIAFEIYDEKTEIDTWKARYVDIYGKEPPSYSRGYFEPNYNLSSCCMHANSIYGTGWWNSAVCTNAHEAFHLYYKTYIYGDDRITWFDEGMAQFISGEKDSWLNDSEKFYEKFMYFLDNYIPISNLNERRQGNNSVSDDLIFQRENVFNGYLASVLIIKYIVDVNGTSYLYELMKNNVEIRTLGNHVLDYMILYYKNKYNIEGAKKI